MWNRDSLIANWRNGEYFHLVIIVLVGIFVVVANLVRFGGAGAVFPFLFVVRRICTFALLHAAFVNVLNFDAVAALSARERSITTNELTFTFASSFFFRSSSFT